MPAKKLPTLTFSHPAAIRDYRRTRRINQTDFWGRVGVTQSGGSRYESGDREIPHPLQLLLQLTYGTRRQANAVLAWLRDDGKCAVDAALDDNTTRVGCVQSVASPML